MADRAKGKANDWSQILFYFAVVLLLIGFALDAGWAIRGKRQADFTGIGKAEILHVSAERKTSRTNNVTRYHFKLRVSAGLSVFECEETRDSGNGWKEGDILPIVYNVKDPKEFVLNTTPEELARWDNTVGIVAVVMMFAGVICLIMGIRLRYLASLNHRKEQ